MDKLNGNTTQVTISETSKEALLQAYLSKAVDAEVVAMGSQDGTVYEIRTAVPEEQLEALLEDVGDQSARMKMEPQLIRKESALKPETSQGTSLTISSILWASKIFLSGL